MGKNKIGKFTIPQGAQFDVIEQEFRMLGLYDAAQSFQFFAEEVKAENGTMFDFLQRTLEKEISQREDERVSRWLQKSGLTPLTTFNDFDFSLQPTIDPVQINELATCRFIEQGKNIMLLGPQGIGKTHLAVALGYEAIQAGLETRMLARNEFIDAIQRGTEDAPKRLFQQLVGVKLLILDDISLFETTDESGKFLSDVIIQRYLDGTSTIFTANTNPLEWGHVFGSNKSRVKRTLDRLFDHRRIITINIMDGVSFRVPEPLTRYDLIKQPATPPQTTTKPILKKMAHFGFQR